MIHEGRSCYIAEVIHLIQFDAALKPIRICNMISREKKETHISQAPFRDKDICRTLARQFFSIEIKRKEQRRINIKLDAAKLRDYNVLCKTLNL